MEVNGRTPRWRGRIAGRYGGNAHTPELGDKVISQKLLLIYTLPCVGFLFQPIMTISLKDSFSNILEAI